VRQRRAAAADLEARGAQQQLVKAGDRVVAILAAKGHEPRVRVTCGEEVQGAFHRRASIGSEDCHRGVGDRTGAVLTS
jgi:hypothetical protein